MEIWLVILFLSRKKFHAKQIVVLSSSMKLGPGEQNPSWRPNPSHGFRKGQWQLKLFESKWNNHTNVYSTLQPHPPPLQDNNPKSCYDTTIKVNCNQVLIYMAFTPPPLLSLRASVELLLSLYIPREHSWRAPSHKASSGTQLPSIPLTQKWMPCSLIAPLAQELASRSEKFKYLEMRCGFFFI